MKLTKEQLNKIIQEELEHSLDEVDLRGFMKKGMEKLKSPFQRLAKYKGDVEYPDKQKDEKEEDDDLDIDIDTSEFEKPKFAPPVEDFLESFNDLIAKKASPELTDLLVSDKGMEFFRYIKNEFLKNKNKKFSIQEQDDEQAELYLMNRVNDLTGDDKKLKEQLLQFLLSWTEENKDVVIDNQVIKNELQALRSYDIEDPPEDKKPIPAQQSQAQAEPASKPAEKPKQFSTPDLSSLYKINDLDSGDPYREYLPLAREAGLSDTKGRELIQKLVSMGLLYKLGTASEPTKDPLKGITKTPATAQQMAMGRRFFENKKMFKSAKIAWNKRAAEEREAKSASFTVQIWQKKFSNQPIEQIVLTPQFNNFVEKLTNRRKADSGQNLVTTDRESVKKFLVSVMSKGKLGYPRDKMTGGDDPEKSQLQKPFGTSEYTPGRSDIRRESKRWQQLAGILKD